MTIKFIDRKTEGKDKDEISPTGQLLKRAEAGVLKIMKNRKKRFIKSGKESFFYEWQGNYTGCYKKRQSLVSGI